MPESGVFQFVIDLIIQIFGVTPPEWLVRIIATAILLGLVVLGIQLVASPILKFWQEIVKPFRYTPEEKRRRLRRQRFADHIESEIRRLNNLEAWNDNRFAELEAEVEAEGRLLFGGVFNIPFLERRRNYKARSLSRALEQSSERLILLEGDPGSGKSVALRHVTQNLANRARKSRNLKSIIPIYINLKGLQRDANEVIDRNLIERFILSSLNRVNDRDIEEFLVDEFSDGIRQGTWLFLFDSFDEIPEVLSSTELDETVRMYAEAIRDFLHGFNKCRGVIASREYRGPRFLGWPKFRILSLSASRREELVNRTGLPIQTQTSVLGGIALAPSDFQVICGNPMFLNLLCEYMRRKEPREFPSHIHLVFEDYIWKRLTRDEERLKQRFSTTPERVKIVAERLAFCMTADTGIGLSPTKNQLKKSLDKYDLSLGEVFDNLLDALVYLKIASSDMPIDKNGEERITFSHRRFQEYFATAVVIENTKKVNPTELLLNARWRETAVVLLQSKSKESSKFLIAEATRLIDEWSQEYDFFQFRAMEQNQEHIQNTTPPFLPDISWESLLEPISKTKERHQKAFDYQPANNKIQIEVHEHRQIDWPPKYLHLLSILQDGFRGTNNNLPYKSLEVVGETLLASMLNGSLLDKKWVLEVVGAAPLEIQKKLLLLGFDSIGNWVRDAAYKQITRLGELFPALENRIKGTLIRMAVSKQLYSQRYDSYVHLSRIGSRELLNLAFTLVWIETINYLLLISSTIVLLGISNQIKLPYVGALFLILWSSFYSLYFSSVNKVIDVFPRISGRYSELFLISNAVYVIGCMLIFFFNLNEITYLTFIYFYAYVALNSWASWFLVRAWSSYKYSLSWLGALFNFVFPFEILSVISLALIYVIVILPSFYLLHIASRPHLYFALIYKCLPVIKDFVIKLFMSWRTVLKWLVQLVLIFAVEYLLVLLIFSDRYSRAISSQLYYSLGVYLPVERLLIGLSIILLGAYLFLKAIRFFSEYRLYRKFCREHNNISILELISFLGGMKHVVLAKWMLIDIRQNQQMTSTEKNSNEITVLINFIELVLSRRLENPLEYLELHSLELREILLSKNVNYQVIINSLVLDEFCKLYEQLMSPR
ncbi:MAG: NACHT domain-containing protein [Desulfobulbaceae bacterium]|nr:NACHT domain-containing protein [Desulfobulbaceae bacterium]